MVSRISAINSSLFMSRFKKLEVKLERKGAKDPGALAAWIGRRKYGAKKFKNLAVKGRHRRLK
jgi:hypothetical protein